MIGIGLQARSVKALSMLMLSDLRAFRAAIKPKLTEAGNIVRKKERELLRGGYGPRVGGQQGRDARGRFTKKRAKGKSRLMSQHRVVIRWSDKAGGWEVFIGPTPGGYAFYGKFHELGTGPRTTASGSSRGSLPKREWMRPAIEATQAQVEEKLTETFKKFRIVG